MYVVGGSADKFWIDEMSTHYVFRHVVEKKKHNKKSEECLRCD
jgi:hypothetical protein